MILNRVGLRLGKEDIQGDECRLLGREFLDQFSVQRARPWPREVEFIERVLIDADDDDGEPQGKGSTESKPDIEETVMVRHEVQGSQADPDEPRTMQQPVVHSLTCMESDAASQSPTMRRTKL
jgi:hypothetical protein